jgi:predicted phosphodiesterase
MSALRIVCLSDTHGRHGKIPVPEGDVLLHAGDFTRRGGAAEVEAFGAFLAGLPHRHKVVIAGNHDFLFQRDPERARALLAGATYLEDSGVAIDDVHFWGSPWQPWFHDWAFNLPRGKALAEKWALVPAGVDVLVTHGPPHGVLDATCDGSRVGCEELALALLRIRPRLHVFGHIHEAYGLVRRGDTLSVNACSCDLSYRPVHPPLVVDVGAGEVRLVAP